jgi:prevent-host-death family protein
MDQSVERIAISKFKATCLAVLERVRTTGRPVIVTRRGDPVAEIIPPPVPPRAPDWMGSMRESAEIVGDLIAPASDEAEWDVLR